MFFVLVVQIKTKSSEGHGLKPQHWQFAAVGPLSTKMLNTPGRMELTFQRGLEAAQREAVPFVVLGVDVDLVFGEGCEVEQWGGGGVSRD